jgi:hypothetical protein
MAHFAEINADNNVVLRCIYVSDEQCNAHGGEDSDECAQWVKEFHPNDPNIDYSNISSTFYLRYSVNTHFNKHWYIDPASFSPGWQRQDDRVNLVTGEIGAPTHGDDDPAKYFSGEKPINKRPPCYLSEDQSKAFRGNRATPGGTWDPVNQIFMDPKPHPSFVLDLENALWWHSVEMPTIKTYSDGRAFDRIYWFEDALEWRALIFNANQDDVEVENRTIEIHQKWNINTLSWEDL